MSALGRLRSNEEVDQDFELAMKLSKEWNGDSSSNNVFDDEDVLSEFSHEFDELDHDHSRKRPNETAFQNNIPRKKTSMTHISDTSKTYDADYELALKLSKEINSDSYPSPSYVDSDYLMAVEVANREGQLENIQTGRNNEDDFLLSIKLSQEDFQSEVTFVETSSSKIRPTKLKTPTTNSEYHKNYEDGTVSVVDPSWETIDPNPDIYSLFATFNKRFFWGKLDCVEVKWSSRMTLCAGVCSYSSRAGFCSVRLSKPLLQYRPRKDLVETLLHEMIHAFLFVTKNDRDRDGHGPRFHSHMYRINKESGANITVYHSFHDEVRAFKTHWWKCDGPCQYKPPYYGMVKRANNRAPGPYDNWWNDHRAMCNGNFIKIKEPENYVNKKLKKEKKVEKVDRIGNYFEIKPPMSSKGTLNANEKITDNALVDLASSSVTIPNVTNSKPFSRSKQILSLMDLNSPKTTVNSTSSQNSRSPKKSNKWVPLPGQTKILQFVNKM